MNNTTPLRFVYDLGTDAESRPDDGTRNDEQIITVEERGI
jgi:hypothetical protein